MKVIYLAAGHDKLDYDNVVYQDLIINRDLGGCMLEVELPEKNIQNIAPSKRQGGSDITQLFNLFIKKIIERND